MSITALSTLTHTMAPVVNHFIQNALVISQLAWKKFTSKCSEVYCFSAYTWSSMYLKGKKEVTMCQTIASTLYFLRRKFGDKIISRRGFENWPPRSCELTSMDFWICGDQSPGQGWQATNFETFECEHTSGYHRHNGTSD